MIGRTGPRLRLLCVLLALGSAAPGGAQEEPRAEGVDPTRLMREAVQLEDRGDLATAERLFRSVLEGEPPVDAAVFGLERVLREQGRLPEVLPVIEDHLRERPGAQGVRRLELWLLAEMDSLAALEAAAMEWIRWDPESVDPYREAADAFEEAFGPQRALAFIDESRSSTGRPALLALETGDLLADLGDRRGAAREWARAVGDDTRNLSLVLLRIDELPGDDRELMDQLRADLEREGIAVGARQGAARLALAAGMEEWAVELASAVVDALEGRARKGFLVQFAQRAEDGRALQAASWAYERLRDDPEGPEEARALDGRLAQLSLSAGDTVGALAYRERISASLPAGSLERRRALARQLDLQVRVGRAEAAAGRLAAYRAEYPGAAELDVLAARVARRLVREELAGGASEVLEGVDGPRSALERAFLDLEAERIQEGVQELTAAVEGMAPVAATRRVELLVYLQGAGLRAAELAGRVSALAHWDRAQEALELAREGAGGVAAEDRAGLLALAADIGDDAGAGDAAAEFRARILREHPDSPEAAAAAVRLARHLAGDPEGDREAARILEELILSRPESAVVPEARRDLEKVRARVSPGGAS